MENSNKSNYMLLGRYQMDLEYFWGNDNKHEKHLYFGDYKKHVRECINLWKKLPIKPEWLRANELIAYKNRIV